MNDPRTRTASCEPLRLLPTRLFGGAITTAAAVVCLAPLVPDSAAVLLVAVSGSLTSTLVEEQQRTTGADSDTTKVLRGREKSSKLNGGLVSECYGKRIDTANWHDRES